MAGHRSHLRKIDPHRFIDLAKRSPHQIHYLAHIVCVHSQIDLALGPVGMKKGRLVNRPHKCIGELCSVSGRCFKRENKPFVNEIEPELEFI